MASSRNNEFIPLPPRQGEDNGLLPRLTLPTGSSGFSTQRTGASRGIGSPVKPLKPVGEVKKSKKAKERAKAGRLPYDPNNSQIVNEISGFGDLIKAVPQALTFFGGLARDVEQAIGTITDPIELAKGLGNTFGITDFEGAYKANTSRDFLKSFGGTLNVIQGYGEYKNALKNNQPILPMAVEDLGNLSIIAGPLAAGFARSAGAAARTAGEAAAAASATGTAEAAAQAARAGARASRLARVANTSAKAYRFTEGVGNLPFKVPSYVVGGLGKTLRNGVYFGPNTFGWGEKAAAGYRAEARRIIQQEGLEDAPLKDPRVLDLLNKAKNAERWSMPRQVKILINRASNRASQEQTIMQRSLLNEIENPEHINDVNPETGKEWGQLSNAEGEAVIANVRGFAQIIKTLVELTGRSPEELAMLGRYDMEPGYSLTPEGARLAYDFATDNLSDMQRARLAKASQGVETALADIVQKAVTGTGRKEAIPPEYLLPEPILAQLKKHVRASGNEFLMELWDKAESSGVLELPPDNINRIRVVSIFLHNLPEELATDPNMFPPAQRPAMYFYERIRRALRREAMGEGGVPKPDMPPTGTPFGPDTYPMPKRTGEMGVVEKTVAKAKKKAASAKKDVERISEQIAKREEVIAKAADLINRHKMARDFINGKSLEQIAKDWNMPVAMARKILNRMKSVQIFKKLQAVEKELTAIQNSVGRVLGDKELMKRSGLSEADIADIQERLRAAALEKRAEAEAIRAQIADALGEADSQIEYATGVVDSMMDESNVLEEQLANAEFEYEQSGGNLDDLLQEDDSLSPDSLASTRDQLEALMAEQEDLQTRLLDLETERNLTIDKAAENSQETFDFYKSLAESLVDDPELLNEWVAARDSMRLIDEELAALDNPTDAQLKDFIDPEIAKLETERLDIQRELNTRWGVDVNSASGLSLGITPEKGSPLWEWWYRQTPNWRKKFALKYMRPQRLRSPAKKGFISVARGLDSLITVAEEAQQRDIDPEVWWEEITAYIARYEDAMSKVAALQKAKKNRVIPEMLRNRLIKIRKEVLQDPLLEELSTMEKDFDPSGNIDSLAVENIIDMANRIAAGETPINEGQYSGGFRRVINALENERRDIETRLSTIDKKISASEASIQKAETPSLAAPPDGTVLPDNPTIDQIVDVLNRRIENAGFANKKYSGGYTFEFKVGKNFKTGNPELRINFRSPSDVYISWELKVSDFWSGSPDGQPPFAEAMLGLRGIIDRFRNSIEQTENGVYDSVGGGGDYTANAQSNSSKSRLPKVKQALQAALDLQEEFKKATEKEPAAEKKVSEQPGITAGEEAVIKSHDSDPGTPKAIEELPDNIEDITPDQTIFDPTVREAVYQSDLLDAMDKEASISIARAQNFDQLVDALTTYIEKTKGKQKLAEELIKAQASMDREAALQSRRIDSIDKNLSKINDSEQRAASAESQAAAIEDSVANDALGKLKPLLPYDLARLSPVGTYGGAENISIELPGGTEYIDIKGPAYLPTGLFEPEVGGRTKKVTKQGSGGYERLPSERKMEGNRHVIFSIRLLAQRFGREIGRIRTNEAFRYIVAQFGETAKSILGDETFAGLEEKAGRMADSLDPEQAQFIFDDMIANEEFVFPGGVAAYSPGTVTPALVRQAAYNRILGQLINNEMAVNGLSPIDPYLPIDVGVKMGKINGDTMFVSSGMREYIGRDVSTGIDNPILNAITQVAAAVKISTLTLSAMWQIGDLVGNVIFAQMTGVDVPTMVRRMGQAKEMLYGKDYAGVMAQIYDLVRRRESRGSLRPMIDPNIPVDVTSPVAELVYESGNQDISLALEERRSLYGINKILEEEVTTGPLRRTRKAARGWNRRMFKINESINRLSRNAYFIELLDRKLKERFGPDATIEQFAEDKVWKTDPELRNLVFEVADTANKWLGDFANLTMAERQLLVPFVPFYSWIKHSHTVFYLLGKEHPESIKWYSYLGSLTYDPTEDELGLRNGGFGVFGGIASTNFLNPFADVVGGPIGGFIAGEGFRPIGQSLGFIPRMAGGVLGVDVTNFERLRRPSGTGVYSRTGTPEATTILPFIGGSVGETLGFTLQNLPPLQRIANINPTPFKNIPGTRVALGPVARYQTGEARINPRTGGRIEQPGGRLAAIGRLFSIPFIPYRSDQQLLDIKKSAEARLKTLEAIRRRREQEEAP